MKKIHLMMILSILLLACSSIKRNEEYGNYEIGTKTTLKYSDTDSLVVNDLRFKPYFDSQDAKKFMYQNFGKWNNVVYTKMKLPILVWDKLKLFEWSDEIYTVGVGGEDYEVELMKINDNKSSRSRGFFVSLNYVNIFICQVKKRKNLKR